MTQEDKGVKLFILLIPLFTLSLLSKIVCSLWQNFEDEVNSMQFDKEYTQRSNLNSKYLDTWQSEIIIEFPRNNSFNSLNTVE